MLPRTYRLKGADIKRIFKNNKKAISNKNIIIYFLKNEFNHPRFAVIVSSQAIKKATKRNRIKRWIKAVLYQLKDRISEGYDIIVFVKRYDSGENYKYFYETISYLLAKEQLLK